MKLNLFKAINAEGKEVVVGWNFTAENMDEENDLSLVRDLIFFGIGDSHPKYAGRTDDPDTELVQKLWYKIPSECDLVKSGEFTLKDEEVKSMLTY